MLFWYCVTHVAGIIYTLNAIQRIHDRVTLIRQQVAIVSKLCFVPIVNHQRFFLFLWILVANYIWFVV